MRSSEAAREGGSEMNIIMLLHCLTLAFVFAKLAMSVEMSWWLVIFKHFANI